MKKFQKKHSRKNPRKKKSRKIQEEKSSIFFSPIYFVWKVFGIFEINLPYYGHDHDQCHFRHVRDHQFEKVEQFHEAPTLPMLQLKCN